MSGVPSHGHDLQQATSSIGLAKGLPYRVRESSSVPAEGGMHGGCEHFLFSWNALLNQAATRVPSCCGDTVTRFLKNSHTPVIA